MEMSKSVKVGNQEEDVVDMPKAEPVAVTKGQSMK